MAGFLNYARAKAITKSDTINYDGTVLSTTGLYQTSTNTKALPADAVFVGTGGIVALVSESGVVTNFTAADGQILPVKSIRVNSTTTDATDLIALYQST